MCELAKLAGEVVQPGDHNCNFKRADGWAVSGNAPKGLTCDQRRGKIKDTNATWYSIERELWEHDMECKEDFVYATMLREPISLMRSFMQMEGDWDRKFISDLRTEMETPSPPIACPPGADPPSRTSSKWGCGVNPSMKFLDNFQVRSLAYAMEVPAGKINITHYERAKKMLHETFDIAIRLEDLPANKNDFFKALGWDARMSTVVPEKTKDHRGPYGLHLQPEEAQWLQEINKWDIELYKSLDYSHHGLLGF